MADNGWRDSRAYVRHTRGICAGSKRHPRQLPPALPHAAATWTDYAFGQALTATGPRTTVNDTRRTAYYGDSTADHTLGDRYTATSPTAGTDPAAQLA